MVAQSFVLVRSFVSNMPVSLHPFCFCSCNALFALAEGTMCCFWTSKFSTLQDRIRRAKEQVADVYPPV